MLRRVFEAWYIVRPNVLKELNNSIPSRNEDLIKSKGGATNTDFIGSMIQVCCCFFIGMQGFSLALAMGHSPKIVPDVREFAVQFGQFVRDNFQKCILYGNAQ